jgi:hypothetical protein
MTTDLYLDALARELIHHLTGPLEIQERQVRAILARAIEAERVERDHAWAAMDELRRERDAAVEEVRAFREALLAPPHMTLLQCFEIALVRVVAVEREACIDLIHTAVDKVTAVERIRARGAKPGEGEK